MKKVEKKDISHDETTIGGACMGGKFMTKKEEREVTVFIEKYKAGKIPKLAKRVLSK